MISLIMLFILSFLIGVGKGISDIVAKKDLWNKSIFSKYNENSYWGHQDGTWKRKHIYKNKILNYLFTTWFVFLSDVWHLGNAIRSYSIFGSLYFIIYTTHIMNIHLLIFLCFLFYLVGFNLFYKKILIKK